MFQKRLRYFETFVRTFQKAGFTAPHPVIPITAFRFHRKRHLEEIVAAFLIAYFGEHLFPGARKAFSERRFIAGDPDCSEAECLKKGELCIGCGEGFMFNEHRSKQKRPEGQCASTLVAEYIGILEIPAIRNLLVETFLCDTEAGCNPMMLAELVKIVNRKPGEDMGPAIAFAVPALEAIVARQMQIADGIAMKPVKGERTLVEHFEAWVKRCKLDKKAPRVYESMKRRFLDSESGKGEIVTELAHIVEAMHRIGKTRKDIADWLEFIFVAAKIEQSEFFDEVDRQEREGEDPVLVDAYLNGEMRMVLLSMVKSESSVAHKAARYRRNAMQRDIPWSQRLGGITVVTNDNPLSLRHHFIIADEEIKSCKVGETDSKALGILDDIARMVTVLELEKMGKPIPWKDWEYFGNPADSFDGFWHYFVEGGMLMNGSHTHPRPHSGLTQADLEAIITFGLTPDGIKAWCQMFP